MANSDVHEKISGIVQSAPVVLFMKGDKAFPQCGFSATVVQILGGLFADFKAVNVLRDPEIRQGIKDFSNWPTIPQLYVHGEFIGGCDIVREMYQSGDLHKLLGVDSSAVEAPTIRVTPRAAEVLKNALAESEPGEVIHLAVDAAFRTDLHIAPKGASDIQIAADVPLVVDPASAQRASGVTIDFVEQGGQAGFKIDNPNAPADIEQLSAEQLKARMDAGEIREIFDVRSPEERAIASIPGARPLDDEAMRYIGGLDRATPLAFFCHRGARSQTAAEHFRDQGFRKLFNLAGGIDAWAVMVDPSLRRY